MFKEKGQILIEISERVTVNDMKQAAGIKCTRNKSLYDLFIVVISDYWLGGVFTVSWQMYWLVQLKGFNN